MIRSLTLLQIFVCNPAPAAKVTLLTIIKCLTFSDRRFIVERLTRTESTQGWVTSIWRKGSGENMWN